MGPQNDNTGGYKPGRGKGLVGKVVPLVLMLETMGGVVTSGLVTVEGFAVWSVTVTLRQINKKITNKSRIIKKGDQL